MTDRPESPQTFARRVGFTGNGERRGLAYYLKFWPVAVALVGAISWGVRLEGKADTGAALREAVIENSKFRVEQTSPAFLELQKENRKNLLDSYATDEEVRLAVAQATASTVAECKAILATHRERRH